MKLKKALILIFVSCILIYNLYGFLLSWYPDLKRKVKYLNKDDNSISYINDNTENITNITYYEKLDGSSIFSNRIGYYEEFNYSKDNISYICSITNKPIEYEYAQEVGLIGEYLKTYKNIDIYLAYDNDSNSDRLVYSATASIKLNNYMYVASSCIYKDKCQNVENTIETLIMISTNFIYEIIDNYLDSNG